MNTETLTLVFAFLGTFVGTVGGIIASAKLTTFRLEQLEKKVDRHNSFAERIPVIEERVNSLDERVDRLETKKGA